MALDVSGKMLLAMLKLCECTAGSLPLCLSPFYWHHVPAFTLFKSPLHQPHFVLSDYSVPPDCYLGQLKWNTLLPNYVFIII